MAFKVIQTKTISRRQYIPRTRSLIDSESFVKTWMTSPTLHDVCERLELTPAQASRKANTLRRKGVRLPRMPHQPGRTAIEKLNKIIERYTK